MMTNKVVRIGIDIGGTFTDFAIFDENTKQFSAFKILSTPSSPEKSVLEGVNRILATLDEKQIVVVTHGSTVATNALLELQGSKSALITTIGFKDIYRIGRQARKHIYGFKPSDSTDLLSNNCVFEITERISSDGEILQSIVLDEVQQIVDQLLMNKVQSVAISLLFSFLYPEHEKLIAGILRQAGFFVSASSELIPEFREFERTATTLVNTYVSPVMDKYLGKLFNDLPDQIESIRLMQSNGGVMSMTEARQKGVHSIFSGPAGGVIGGLNVAKLSGFDNIITFDMGGTSTDISLLQGDVQLTTRSEVSGIPISIPTIDIHTIGAGGGSIAYLDSGKAFKVGPVSAGSNPGPVCYGLGGKLPTVTDANLVLGRMLPDSFLGGEMPLDVVGTELSINNLGIQARISSFEKLSLSQTTALGIVQVVNAHMERALRLISTQRGYDISDFTLVCYGGAAGLHATKLASTLGIKRVLLPRSASIMSALGMVDADFIQDYVQTVMIKGEIKFDDLEIWFNELSHQAEKQIVAEFGMPENTCLIKTLDLRYVGQSYELNVPFTRNYRKSFDEIHFRSYGHSHSDDMIEIVNIRIKAVGLVNSISTKIWEASPEEGSVLNTDVKTVVLDGHLLEVPIYRGEDLKPGNVIDGPGLIVYSDNTILIFQGDVAIVDRWCNIIVEVTGYDNN